MWQWIRGWLVPELNLILASLNTLTKGIQKMSAIVDQLKTDVQNLKTVDDSLKALVTTLAQQIRDNAEDPVALKALADDVEGQVADISKFVTDNTPAAPATPTT